MKNFTKFTLFVLLVSFVLFGCSPKPPALEGTWKQDLAASGDLFVGKTLTFQGANVVYTENTCKDAECATILSTVEGKGTFTLGTKVNLPSKKVAFQINYAGLVWTKVLNDAKEVAAAKKQATCGTKDWAAGVAVDVTNCGLTFGLPSFDIVYGEKGTLFVGDLNTGDGSADTARPTDINQAAFKK